MFDGAHIGHQSILKQLNTIAEEIDGESILVTFNPHPRMVLQPNCDLKGLEIGLSLVKENATDSNSSELNWPEPNLFKTPPLDADDLSSENCFANSSNFSPCCIFL